MPSARSITSLCLLASLLGAPSLVLVEPPQGADLFEGGGDQQLEAISDFDGLVSEAKDAYRSGDYEYRELTDERAGEASVAITGYAVGSILLVGGASWFAYDHFCGTEQPSQRALGRRPQTNIALIPSLDIRGASVVLRGRF